MNIPTREEVIEELIAVGIVALIVLAYMATAVIDGL